MKVSSYLHVMEGRLRVKVPEMKRSVSKALHIEEVIKGLEGVISATANPTTGNVLVFFDPEQLTHSEILLELKKEGYLREEVTVSSFQLSTRIVDTVSHAVARSVAESLMERAILALL